LSLRSSLILNPFLRRCVLSLLSFSTTTPTTDISTLSLHDALPILASHSRTVESWLHVAMVLPSGEKRARLTVPSCPVSASFSRPDRKSTRLNSSHGSISYAVFCLKKKKQ